MALPSSIQFIDLSLSSITNFPLSYPNSHQKWLIRQHLLSFLQNYPTFSPSIDTFIHNDGTSVNLLTANGHLHISSSTPTIPLTMWLHQSYPYVPPMVFLTESSIHPDHPFVDSSGAVSTPYLQTWGFPNSNVSDFVHNLVKLFSRDHPLCFSSFNDSPKIFGHPSVVSRREAFDRLSGMLHYDMVVITSKTDQEMEEISELQVEMLKRADITTAIIHGLENEKSMLEERAMCLAKEIDVVTNWIRFNDPRCGVTTVEDEIDDTFEAVDDMSKLATDCSAADMAIEDLIYALDKAVEEEVMAFDVYIKQVRNLAREQFIHKARLLKIKGS